MKCAEILKLLGDENRLKLICMLASQSHCVCDLETYLAISQSSTSKHLQRLKSAGLIESEKKGQWVYYKLTDGVFERYPYLSSLITCFLSEQTEENVKKTTINC